MSVPNQKKPASSCGEPVERTSVLVVGGLDNADAVRRAENALRAIPGVESASVNMLTRLSTVRHSTAVAPSALADAVNAVGLHATLAKVDVDGGSESCLGETLDLIASRKVRFYAGAVLTVLLFVVNSVNANTSWKLMLLFLLATPAQIAVGWEYYIEFFKSIRRWRFNLDSLVVVATTAAYAQGVLCFLGQSTGDPDLSRWSPQFHSAALILTVVSLGKWLESLARDSADDLWGGIEALLPREACVLRDGREMIIPAGAVAVGDIVLVAPGERVPVDGEVLEGCTHIDESPLTGDIRPVSKVIGDRVVVASLNGSGFLRVRAMGVGPHSTLAHISMLVERARIKKGRSEVMADRIAAALVPFTMLLSMAAFAFWYCGPLLMAWISNKGWISITSLDGIKESAFAFLLQTPSVSSALRPAIAVLVAACPCALAMATPLTVLIATRLAARRGILIKGGGALEAAARATDVVFDQSGTMTCGVFRVRDVLAAPDINKESVLALAAALGGRTRQDSAKCIEREARRRGIAVPIAENCEMLAGGGVGGFFGETEFRLFPRSIVTGSGVSVHPSLAARAAEAESEGAAVMFLCRTNGDAIGAIALEERIKEGAAEAVAILRAEGTSVHLISGESLAQTRTVGKACGLREPEIHALATSEDKAEFARGLREAGRSVAVIGDGASDAPALAAADVGIALGAGAEAAVDSAQIVLVSGDVRGVPAVLKAARVAERIIRQNVWIALSFTAIMLPTAFFGILSAATGAALMAGSSIIVMLNSLRLSLSERNAKFELAKTVIMPPMGIQESY
ncbi:MAG: cation-translocating P-type ATPase [Planctomycetota bacterium]